MSVVTQLLKVESVRSTIAISSQQLCWTHTEYMYAGALTRYVFESLMNCEHAPQVSCRIDFSFLFLVLKKTLLLTMPQRSLRRFVPFLNVSFFREKLFRLLKGLFCFQFLIFLLSVLVFIQVFVNATFCLQNKIAENGGIFSQFLFSEVGQNIMPCKVQNNPIQTLQKYFGCDTNSPRLDYPVSNHFVAHNLVIRS